MSEETEFEKNREQIYEQIKRTEKFVALIEQREKLEKEIKALREEIKEWHFVLYKKEI